MKLIDFEKSGLFKKIRSKMGIPKDYKADFEGEIRFEKNEFSKAIWKEIEMGRGLDISLNDLVVGEDNTLEYKGQKMILYIRDINDYNRQPKFHVSWCSTIIDMRDKGRFNRYVVSRKKDGSFFVNVIENGTKKIIEENMLLELKVCKNCLKELDYKGYINSSYKEKENICDNFSVSQFLEMYETKFRQIPKYTDITSPLNKYAKNWSDISKKYRSLRNWKCEKCGKDCSDDRGMIDAHHIDGNKYNNSYSNLKALCKKCHSEEPMHQHYKI